MQKLLYKKRVLFVGMPDMAFVCFDTLYKAGVNIVGVVPPSRKNSTHNFFMSFLENYNCNVIPYNSSLKEPDFLQKIKDLDIDIAVVCSYNKLFPKEFLECSKDGFINCHPSLLPKYRGANPYSNVIINNEKATGMTLHFMNEAFDEGDIIAQRVISLNGHETMGILFNHCNYVAAEMLVQILSYYENNELPRIKQLQGNFVTAPNFDINKGDNYIDWTQPAEYIERFVRALNPFILAMTNYKAQQVKIMSVSVDKKYTKYPPGAICELKKGLGIATGAGILYINILQFGSYAICDGNEFIKIFKPKLGDIFTNE